MPEEIKTEITIDHTNQLPLPTLKTLNNNVEARLGYLDKAIELSERRIAGVPRDRSEEYWRERVKDIRDECFRDAFAKVETLKNVKGVAEAQRQFYTPEWKLERGKLHDDAGINATMILAEQGENRNSDGPGLVHRAEKAAADGDFARARLIRGEVTARGENLALDHRDRIETVIGAMKVEAPELEIIDQLERNTFELFEKLNQIRYGARRFSIEQLEKMSQEEFEAAITAQQRAGIRQ